MSISNIEEAQILSKLQMMHKIENIEAIRKVLEANKQKGCNPKEGNVKSLFTTAPDRPILNQCIYIYIYIYII